MSVKKNSVRKNILITGGMGFIGINLIKHFLKYNNHSLYVISRGKSQKFLKFLPFSVNKINLITGDLLDKKLLAKVLNKSNVVIHLAGNTQSQGGKNNAENLIRDTIEGTTVLLQECRKINGMEKLLLFSSSGVYADGVKNKNSLSETAQIAPLNIYSASKLATEHVALTYSKKLPIVILRPFNVYGPYQSINKPVPLFITRLLKGGNINLNHSGKQMRDWIYVEDVVLAIAKVISAPQKKVVGEIFNVSTGKAVSIAKVAERILHISQLPVSRVKKLKNGGLEVMYNVGDARKIKRRLEWSPKYSLDKGLSETIRWYQYNTGWWNNYV